MEISYDGKSSLVYCSSFYGSVLWDLEARDCDRLYKAWNVMVRMVYNLDRCTHRFFIEQISECRHPKVFLRSRLVKLVKAASESEKWCVSFLMKIRKNDLRTTTGMNLDKMRRDFGMDKEVDLIASDVIKRDHYMRVPEESKWKVNMVKEIMRMEIPGFEKKETEEITRWLCTS